jgi:hypothetical protein
VWYPGYHRRRIQCARLRDDSVAHNLVRPNRPRRGNSLRFLLEPTRKATWHEIQYLGSCAFDRASATTEQVIDINVERCWRLGVEAYWMLNCWKAATSQPLYWTMTNLSLFRWPAWLGTCKEPYNIINSVEGTQRSVQRRLSTPEVGFGRLGESTCIQCNPSPRREQWE